MNELPESWATTTVGEAINIVRGITFSRAERRDQPSTGYVACLRTSNVQSSLEAQDLIYAPVSKVATPERLIRDGDVVISMSNSLELVGKVARATASHQGLTFGAFLSVLRSKALDSGFLYYLFRSREMQARLRATASQTVNIANLSISGMNPLEIRLPPRNEQRRIVAKLDSLFTRTRSAREELARIPPLIEHYKQAILAAAFRGELTADWRTSRSAEEMLAWETVAIVDIAEAVFDGPFGSHLKSKDYTDHGARVVRLENIGHLEFFDDKRTYVSTGKYEQLCKHSLFAGDIVFSSFVDQEIRVCRIPDSIPEATINKADCFCIRADPSVVDTRWLELRLSCRSTYDDLRAAVHGATRPRISLKTLRAYCLQLPPLDEQLEIVRLLDADLAWLHSIGREAQKAARLLDHLDQATLAKAFRGELVPQDPNDEPAAKLLERIRAARELEPKPKRGRPKVAAG